jgi:hypothetical protein
MKLLPHKRVVTTFGVEMGHDRTMYCTVHHAEMVRAPDARTLYVCPVQGCPHFFTLEH